MGGAHHWVSSCRGGGGGGVGRGCSIWCPCLGPGGGGMTHGGTELRAPRPNSAGGSHCITAAAEVRGWATPRTPAAACGAAGRGGWCVPSLHRPPGAGGRHSRPPPSPNRRGVVVLILRSAAAAINHCPVQRLRLRLFTVGAALRLPLPFTRLCPPPPPPAPSRSHTRPSSGRASQPQAAQGNERPEATSGSCEQWDRHPALAHKTTTLTPRPPSRTNLDRQGGRKPQTPTGTPAPPCARGHVSGETHIPSTPSPAADG